MTKATHATHAKFVMAALAAATALCAAPFASAQSNTITVDMAGVSATVAKNISVDATKIPTTLQVPVGIAAAACGVDASTLTQKGGTAGAAATCKATTTTPALDQLVQKEMKAATVTK